MGVVITLEVVEVGVVMVLLAQVEVLKRVGHQTEPLAAEQAEETAEMPVQHLMLEVGVEVEPTVQQP